MIPSGPRYSRLICLSAILLSMLVTASLFMFIQMAETHKAQSSTYTLRTLLQTGPSYQPLSTHSLAEILGLSSETGINLLRFDLEEGRRRLLATHAIKEASLKKIRPATLWVNYSLRTPIAEVSDYANTWIDEEGILFPAYPYFRPRHLPHIHFGTQAFVLKEGIWGSHVNGEQLSLAKALLSYGSDLDLSQMDAPTLGERELILTTSQGDLLRLTPEEWEEQLADYRLLQETYLPAGAKRRIIDLRIPQLAYVRSIDD